MKKYTTLAAAFAAGLASAAPNYAKALTVEIGVTESYTPRAGEMLAVPVVWEVLYSFDCPPGYVKKKDCKQIPDTLRARVILEKKGINPSTVTYRVIVDRYRDGNETLQTVLDWLRKVRPEATIDDLVEQNNLKERMLPLDGLYFTLTYTVPVGKTK